MQWIIDYGNSTRTEILKAILSYDSLKYIRIMMNIVQNYRITKYDFGWETALS